MKITAYAAVMPILILSGMMIGAGGAPVEFVAKKEIKKVFCFIFNMKGSLTVDHQQFLKIIQKHKSVYILVLSCPLQEL